VNFGTQIAAVGFALLCGYQAAHAELTLTAAPRETAQAGARLYGPLAASVSEILGEKVVYRHPGDFLTYSNEMRAGQYDLVFDGPHLAAWRIEHLQHEAVARLPGSLVFKVVTKHADIETLDDLIGKKVCGLLSPNLATLTMLYEYKNPAQQPIFRDVKGGFVRVFEALKSDKCIAAVFRSDYYDNKVSQQEKDDLKVIFISKPVPNQTITASPRVPEEGKRNLAQALTSKEEAVGAENLFQRFSKNKPEFIATSGEEFTHLNRLLEGVVWGW
jgi:ABC-type phosphate/phosphonate transport system substrate-binding protein